MGLIADAAWVTKGLMRVNASTGIAVTQRNSDLSSFKFTDTSWGGSFAFNAPPQWNPMCDIRMFGGETAAPKTVTGMGRKFSSMIDDNQQQISIRCGVPEYMGLAEFLMNFHNHHAVTLARTGRGTFESIVGALVNGALGIGLFPFQLGAAFLGAATGHKPRQFYTLKPTMAPYWWQVNVMLQKMISYMGLIDDGSEYNILEIVTKAHRQVNAMRGSDGGKDGAPPGQDYPTSPLGAGNYGVRAHMFDWFDSKEEGKAAEAPAAGVTSADKSEEPPSASELVSAHLNRALEFVHFYVNATTGVNDTFNNSSTEPALKSKFNAISGNMAGFRHNFAQGDVTFDLADSILGAAAKTVAGAAEAVSLSGISAFLGSSFMSMPDVWQDSSSNLASMNYTIELRCPYGIPELRFKRIIVPICMLLALALPRQAGNASYTIPYLVEVYDKGRAQTRIGMVESLTIRRGEGNIGWSRYDEPLNVVVDLTIKDLSGVMAVPMYGDNKVFDFSSNYMDYMAGLASLDPHSMINHWRNLKYNFNAELDTFKSYFSKENWAMRLANGNFVARGISETIKAFDAFSN